MSTHGPIAAAYRHKMEKLARAIDEYWNADKKGHERKTGFCLLVFEFGEIEPSRDRINYISNAERKDMIIALKELVARFEGQDHATSETKQ